jgi:hypothetical protein
MKIVYCDGSVVGVNRGSECAFGRADADDCWPHWRDGALVCRFCRRPVAK